MSLGLESASGGLALLRLGLARQWGGGTRGVSLGLESASCGLAMLC